MSTFLPSGSRRDVVDTTGMTPRQARIALGLPYVERDEDFIEQVRDLEGPDYEWAEEEVRDAPATYTAEQELAIGLRVGAIHRDDVRAALGWPPWSQLAPGKRSGLLSREEKRTLARAMWNAGSPVAWIKEACECHASDVRKWTDDLPARARAPRGLTYKRGAEHGNSKNYVPKEPTIKPMSRRKKTSSDTIAMIRRLRSRGWLVADIALACDVCAFTVCRYSKDIEPAKRQKAPKPPKERKPGNRIDDARRATVCEMYRAGAKLRVIAATCGVCLASVRTLTTSLPRRQPRAPKATVQ